MTERQRRFAEIYAAEPNATRAAEAAGYSGKTAYSQGQRLLKNVEVATHIRELQEQAAWCSSSRRIRKRTSSKFDSETQ